MLYQIKHRFAGSVLFEGDFDTLRLCVESAVKAGVDLRGADLRGARLNGVDLRAADLGGAFLGDASLDRANLRGAILNDANLDGASLRDTNLRSAVLRDGCIATGAPARRATRSDGYEFLLWPTDKGWRVGAGCRWFELDEAWEHWTRTRGDDDPLGRESLDILTLFTLHVEREG